MAKNPNVNRATARPAENAKSWALAVVALIGLGISCYLSSHYFDVRSGGAAMHSSCDMNATVCCSCVASSSYAEIVPGVPISSLGAGWFLAIFLVSLFLTSKSAEWRREALRAEFLMTGVSLLTSLAYLAIMAFRIKTYCLWCMGVDAASLASFILVLTMRPESISVAPLDFGRWKAIAGTVAVSVFVGIVAMKGFDNGTLTTDQIADLVGTSMATPAVSVNAGPEFPSIGPANAPITVVEFSDYQCPHCKLAVSTVNAVHARYPDLVRFVFRFYPLDQSCNHKMDHPLHAAACEAARAAFCANRQGKYTDVSEAMFEQQETLAPGKPIEIAGAAGADKVKMAECMSSMDSGNAVARDLSEADSLGLTSTPTFYANGHKIEGAFPLPFWVALLDVLKKQAH